MPSILPSEQPHFGLSYIGVSIKFNSKRTFLSLKSWLFEEAELIPVDSLTAWLLPCSQGQIYPETLLGPCQHNIQDEPGPHLLFLVYFSVRNFLFQLPSPVCLGSSQASAHSFPFTEQSLNSLPRSCSKSCLGAQLHIVWQVPCMAQHMCAVCAGLGTVFMPS